MSKHNGSRKRGGSNAAVADRDGARGYPRPQMERSEWTNLNGPWDFAIDAEARWTAPQQVRFNRRIQVPFAPEAPASGIGETGFFQACWYRRTFDAPKLSRGQRLLLHFGAVDYDATVWVNGKLAAHHEGGYTPFAADITELVARSGAQELIVRAADDPHDLAKPRGKQDWLEHPHSIWYYRTSGIWQTVWLERVPATRIDRLRWACNFAKWELGLEAHLAGQRRDDLRLRVCLYHRKEPIADDTYALGDKQEIARTITLADPGIDDYRNDILWSLHHPTLLPAEIELIDDAGKVIDSVRSYTAMREVSIVGDRFALNGRPTQLQLVLDQGYWEDGGLTAPDDDAIRRDVELVKAMGFNGVRKHQKIEDPRFLYWADRIGIFVWEEMPSVYRFSIEGVQRLAREWTDAILRDASHPCIVAWVPFNESWGVPNLPESPAQRHYIQGIYHLTKTLDPSRPVVGNDGWEAAATDIVGIHDYDASPERIEQRYGGRGEAVGQMLANEQPAQRVLLLGGFGYNGQPIMLTEFGGIAFSRDVAHTWGYSRVGSSEDLAKQYYRLLDTLRSLPMLAGFCYTQFTDTYQEANGLLYMDRTPKFPLEQMACATRGARCAEDQEMEKQWRREIRRTFEREQDSRVAEEVVDAAEQ